MNPEIINSEIMKMLINAGWACAIFLCAYGSNMVLSLYYNIRVLDEVFDPKKLADSGIKVLTVLVGSVLLVVGVVLLPRFADYVGWAIPEEFTMAIQSICSLGFCLYISCRYMLEAFGKLKGILEYTQQPTSQVKG